MASHNQDTSSKSAVIAYVKANKLSAHAPNFTVTKNGRHPDVKGNGFVPYYIVFDHTGKLHAHHMCGSYHGGDGWRMIEIVDELLEKTPAIYLGREPFQKIDALAQQVGAGKSLAASIKQLDAKLEADPDAETKAELERLKNIVTVYRDRQLGYASGLEGTQPARVVPELKEVAKTFKGTSLAAAVEEKLAAMEVSKALKAAVDIQKKFDRIVRSFEKIKEKKRTDVIVERTVKKLEKLIEGQEELPFAKTVEAYLADLR